MAKAPQQKWLGDSVPFILKVDGPHGTSKETAFQLCLDFNALGLVEQHTGIPLANPGQIFQKLNFVSNIKILFWAAIQAYHSDEFAGDRGLDIVGSYLNYRNSGSAVDAVWTAFLKAVPDEVATKLKAALESAKADAEGGAGQQDPIQTAQASS